MECEYENDGNTISIAASETELRTIPAEEGAYEQLRGDHTKYASPQSVKEPTAIISWKLAVVMCAIAMLFSAISSAISGAVVYTISKKQSESVTTVTNGGWSLWATWTACSSSCGGGIQTRARLCNNPIPSQFGSACDRDYHETKFCSARACPVTNGGWSLWATWTACSSGCGGGIQTRARLCNNPIPSQFGSACDGDYHETKFCSARACPVPVVAFSVTEPTNTLVGGSKSEGRPAFTRIITNIGNGYDNTTGYFHAPVAGIYHFSLSFTTGTTGRTSCLIERNFNHIVETSVSHQSAKIPASTSTYLKLKIRQQVNIYCYGWERANHDMTMIFNGALISQI